MTRNNIRMFDYRAILYYWCYNNHLTNQQIGQLTRFKLHKYILLLTIIPCLILMHPSFAFPEASRVKDNKVDRAGKVGTGPIEISSNTLEVDNKQHIVTFAGDVHAKRGEFSINCQTLLLYYNSETGGKGSGNQEFNFDKIIATGKVKIDHSDGGLAMAEKAVYYQDEDKVVLTGNPAIKQANDFVEGSKITLFLKEKRSIVEGSDKKKIRAVLFPGSEKGNIVDR